MFRRVCRSLSSQGRQLATPSSSLVCKVRGTAHRAVISKIGRKDYIRRFPITIMRPDGSTIQIRAAEPREFVQLPVDLKALTEEERRHRLAARKLKVKQIKEDIIDDNFDMDRYAQLWKSKDELKAQSKLRSSNEDAKTSKNKMAEKNSMKKTAGEAVDEGAENKTVEKQMRVEKSRVGAKKNS